MLCLLDERLNILKLAKKQEKTKNKNLKQTGLQLAFRTTLSGVKQRNILAFEVSVQKKTLILLENQLLYLCKVSRIFFGTYKKKSVQVENGDHHSKNLKNKQNFGVETGTRTRTITDIHIGPPPSINTKQTHKYCFFRNLKYLKDLFPVFRDLKQKNVLDEEEERGKRAIVLKCMKCV